MRLGRDKDDLRTRCGRGWDEDRSRPEFRLAEIGNFSAFFSSNFWGQDEDELFVLRSPDWDQDFGSWESMISTVISKIKSRYQNRGPHIDNLEKDIPESQAPDLAKVSQICKKKLDFQV